MFRAYPKNKMRPRRRPAALRGEEASGGRSGASYERVDKTMRADSPKDKPSARQGFACGREKNGPKDKPSARQGFACGREKNGPVPPGAGRSVSETGSGIHRRLAAPVYFAVLAALLFGLQSGCCSCRQHVKQTTEAKTRWVTGPYGKLRVEDGGGLGGVPVVFVHGLGGGLEVWRAQLAHLRPNRRAIALDLHGMGESAQATDGTYTIPSFANDIRAVADSLGLGRFILVGHSLGGLVVADYAGRYPDKVAGLLLDDPAGDLSGLPKAQADQWLKGFAPENYEAFREKWFGEMLSTAKPDVRQAVMGQIHRTPRQVMAASAAGLFAFDPKPSLRAYKGPALTVITAQNNEPYSLQNVTPGLKSQIVPGTSHWIMMDDPEAFNAVMDQFMATIQ